MDMPDPSAYSPEQLAKTREWLEKELLKGLEGGPDIEMDDEDWDRLLKEARERVSAKRAS